MSTERKGTPAERVAEFEAAEAALRAFEPLQEAAPGAAERPEVAPDVMGLPETTPEHAAARERRQRAMAAMFADIEAAAREAGVTGRWHAAWNREEGRWIVRPIGDD